MWSSSCTGMFWSAAKLGDERDALPQLLALRLELLHFRQKRPESSGLRCAAAKSASSADSRLNVQYHQPMPSTATRRSLPLPA